MMVTDDELTGFAIRVSPSGSKTFVFQYRFGGHIRRLRLGVYGDLTPAQARKLAQEARGRVAAGGDPVGERSDQSKAAIAAEAARRASAAEAQTLADLVNAWQETGLRGRSDAHRREAPRSLRRAFAELLAHPAHRLDAGMIQLRLDRLARDRPVTANRVHAYGRAMFAWAVKRRLVPSNPFVLAAADSREASRDRVLTDAELGEAWRTASRMAYPFGPYLGLLILTLQRRGEVAGMRWDELAADGSSWTIPAARAKNGKAHVVHLALAARDILATMPRIIDTVTERPSPLVFSTTGRTPISGFQNAREQLNRLILMERAQRAGRPMPAREIGVGKKAGPSAPDWRLHDLRRTGVTVLARLGVAPHVADRLLNHVQGTIRGVAAVYQRHEFLAEREAAIDRWALHVLEAAALESPPASNVIQLPQRSATRSDG